MVAWIEMNKGVSLFSVAVDVLSFLPFLCILSSVSAQFSDDRMALLELKRSFSDPNGILSSWNVSSSNHCTWFGVSCDSDFRVSELKIDEFFGVKPPCLLCTVNMHTDLVCEAHANQISELVYCSNHRKLGQSQDMCLHCLDRFVVIQNQKEKVGESGEGSLKCCCCCGMRLDHCNTTMFSWRMPLQESICSNHIQEGLNSGDMKELEAGTVEDEDGILQKFGTVEKKETSIMKANSHQHLQIFLRYYDHDMAEDQGVNNRSIFDQMEVVLEFDINVKPKLSQEEQNSLVLVVDEFQEMADSAWEMHLDDLTASASEEVAQIDTNDNEADVSIGTEIPDIDDEVEDQESVHSYNCIDNSPSTGSANLDEADDGGLVLVKEKMVEFQCLPLIQDRERVLKIRPPFHLELNQIEDDGVPNTPASVDSLTQFNRNSIFPEKKDSDSEESADESVTRELDGDEGVVSIESLKSAPRAERKTLEALYAELEEERSASAEGVTQTMAMINRLQEEKAALQMEAFQYQRMMEEQSEYDQEALQLMNELMVKKDKEKQELDKELEVYRKKVFHYETNEKMRVLQSSSASSTCSISGEDSDGLSSDSNQEGREAENSRCVKLKESLADFEEERLSIEEANLLSLDGEEIPEENGEMMRNGENSCWIEAMC